MRKLKLYKRMGLLAVLLAVFFVIFVTSAEAIQTYNVLIVETASPMTYNAVGQNITFDYTVINIGSSPIPGYINVTDNKTGLVALSDGVPELDVIGGTYSSPFVTGQAKYTIKQVDLDVGSITNLVSITTPSSISGITSDTTTVKALERSALNKTTLSFP
jgi:large repetitive protein